MRAPAAGRVAEGIGAVDIGQALSAQPVVETARWCRAASRCAGRNACTAQRLADFVGVADAAPAVHVCAFAVDEALTLGTAVAGWATDIRARHPTAVLDAAIGGSTAVGISGAGRARGRAERDALAGFGALFAGGAGIA